MPRNFGIMSGRASLGGESADAAASLGSYAPSDFIRDALLGSITAVALSVSLFIVLFVRA